MRQDGKIIAFVFVAALLLSGRLMAFPHDETFYFTAISDKNSSNIGGISQTDILSISQDQRGVMWIGTSYGLNSFDSYNYVDYNVEDGLAGSLIQAVQSVGDSIFIGTRTGFSILDLKTSSVFNFTLDLEEDNPNYVVNYISEPVNGKLVVCTTIGIFVYNMGTKEFYQYHPVDGKKTHDVHHVDYSTYDSTWWVAAHSGLIHFNYADESFECYYCNPQNDSSLLDNRVTCVKAFDQNTIFVGTKSGLCMFSPSRKTFQKINLNNTSNYNAYQNEITSLLKYDDNSILIGTNGNGLFHYDVLLGKFKQYKHTDGHSYSISDDRIHCLFKDLCGDVWIGTQNGVCSIEKYRPKFYSYRTDTENDKTSLRNAVWCIQEISPEIFWIGTVSGVNIFNRVTGECKHFHLKNDLNNFPYNSKVRAFYYDKANDKIWIGTRYSGVYCYDFKTGQSRSFNEINNKDYYLFSSPINSIIGDADDNIWIATTYGLARLNKNTYEIKNYFNDPTDQSSLSTNGVYDLYLNEENELWLTSNNGLMRYNPTIDGFDSFVLPSSIGKTHRFSSNVFYSITADPSGILWIGSRTSGIVRFNPKDLTFQVFSEEEGLVSNLVYAICVDEKTGNIWASGNKGLSCYNPQDNTVVNYSSNDGLQGDGFCFDASFVSAASEMYFGGYNGFNVFNPENIIMNDTWPKTTIVSYRENGEIKSRLIKDGDTIVLHSKDCVFGFEFSALDYATPHNSRYKFCLENHDERWTERESDERYVEYFQVSPGIYTFKVVASNSSNIWDEDGVAVTIIIRPRWNETLMFKIAVVLLIIMFIVLILILIISNIKNKLKMQEKYHEMEKQMFLLKQKSLQLQMNPHVLFNMLNSIQGYVLRNDSDSAVYYLNKFALLMRRILSNSTETYISLGKELDAIKLYIELEMMRFDNLFNYEITISPSIDVNYFEITPMILQPYVENAIIHGLRYKTSTGHLKITITNDALDTVLCTIEDNGVGRQRAMEIEREADQQRKSHGMRITQERLDMINQFTQDVYTVKVIDLLDHDGKPAGTRVEIRIFGKE